MKVRPRIQTHDPLVNERLCCTKKTPTCQGAGHQCVQVIQEVTQDLIHEFLRKALPSGTGKLLRNIVDPTLHVVQCAFYPQAEGVSYGNVSTVDRMGGVHVDIHRDHEQPSC